jgi:hypothetical protein
MNLVQGDANGTGVLASSTPQFVPPASLIRVSNSTITMNGTGVSGDVWTRGDNTLELNDTDGTFSGTFNRQ